MAVQTAINPDVKKLGELIRDSKVAMLTTAAPDGQLHSRPMATQVPDSEEFDGTLWFFTRDDSPKVAEIQEDEHVNVSYADSSSQNYVSVAGRATLVHDRGKIDELWSPIHKAWFPDGKDDPHLALLRVDAESAEYWDSPSSKVVQLFGIVKALATGQEADLGENRKINF